MFMAKQKQIIIYAEFDNDEKTIREIKVDRNANDDQTVLIFATLYSRSQGFARIMQSFANFLKSTKQSKALSEQFLSLIEKIEVEA